MRKSANIAAAFEIFRSIWLIEDRAGLAYFQAWEERSTNPAAYDDDADDKQPASILNPIIAASGNSILFAPTNLYSKAAQEFKGFEGAAIAVIPIEGALMKTDYCGMAGTATLLAYFRMAEKAQSVQEIFLLINSPGGAVNGTETFADAIAQSKKEVTAIVDGMCCSAAYWLASPAKRIVATSRTDIVGSIGTKVSFYDSSAAMEARGVVLREFTATKSFNKGKDFAEASKGNGKLIIKSMLDPMNDVFLQAVETNRAGKIAAANTDVLTGTTYVATTAKENGLIDGIQSLETIFSQAIKQHTPNLNFNMKSFKSVLHAAAVASVYSDNNFFGLTEEELEKVEVRMNEMETAAIQAQETISQLSAQNSQFKIEAEHAAASIKQLGDEIAALQADNTRLAAITAGKTQIIKGEDPEQENNQPKVALTSVDKWFADLNK